MPAESYLSRAANAFQEGRIMPTVSMFWLTRLHGDQELFTMADVAKWPPGLLEKLVDEEVIWTAPRLNLGRCPTCWEPHPMKIATSRSADGHTESPYVTCPREGKISVTSDQRIVWRLCRDNGADDDDGEEGGEAAKNDKSLTPRQHESLMERRLAKAVADGDCAAAMHVLLSDILYWVKQLHPALLNYFFAEFSEMHRRVCDASRGSTYRHADFVCSFIGGRECCRLLAFHSSSDVAEQFVHSISELQRRQLEFAEKVSRYGGDFGPDIDYPHMLELEMNLDALIDACAAFTDDVIILVQQLMAFQLNGGSGSQLKGSAGQRSDASNGTSGELSAEGFVKNDYKTEQGEWLTAEFVKRRYNIPDSRLNVWRDFGCPHLDGRKLRAQKTKVTRKQYVYFRLDIQDISAARDEAAEQRGIAPHYQLRSES